MWWCFKIKVVTRRWKLWSFRSISRTWRSFRLTNSPSLEQQIFTTLPIYRPPRLTKWRPSVGNWNLIHKVRLHAVLSCECVYILTIYTRTYNIPAWDWDETFWRLFARSLCGLFRRTWANLTPARRGALNPLPKRCCQPNRADCCSARGIIYEQSWSDFQRRFGQKQTCTHFNQCRPSGFVNATDFAPFYVSACVCVCVVVYVCESVRRLQIGSNSSVAIQSSSPLPAIQGRLFWGIKRTTNERARKFYPFSRKAAFQVHCSAGS